VILETQFTALRPGDQGVVLIVVDGLVLGRRAAAACGVKPPMVEPVDVLQGGRFQLVEAAPRPVPLDQFGLVEAVHGLGECVVVRISFATNGYGRAGLGEPFGVADLQVLGTAIRVNPISG
jgi:hypothetical protein